MAAGGSSLFTTKPAPLKRLCWLEDELEWFDHLSVIPPPTGPKTPPKQTHPNPVDSKRLLGLKEKAQSMSSLAEVVFGGPSPVKSLGDTFEERMGGWCVGWLGVFVFFSRLLF